MRMVSVVLPVAFHGLGCLAGSSMPRSAGTCRLLSRHPPAAQILPHSGKIISYSPALRCGTPDQVFENCGCSRIRTYEPLACKASALPLSYAPNAARPGALSGVVGLQPGPAYLLRAHRGSPEATYGDAWAGSGLSGLADSRGPARSAQDARRREVALPRHARRLA